MLLADLHTHTVASGHGYSTLTENAEQAFRAGLELIATTDHGPRVPQGGHEWYFWNQKMTPSIYKGVRILNGCEANIVSDTANGVDLIDEVLEVLDFVQIGLHQCCGLDGNDRLANTNAVLKALENPLVDQLNHPGNDEYFPLYLDPIVESAAHNNVIIELNNHSFDAHGSRGGSAAREIEFALAAHQAGVVLSIGSDAHYHTLIGQFDAALTAAIAAGLSESDFINTDARSVLAHLLDKRPRPRMDWGPVIST